MHIHFEFKYEMNYITGFSNRLRDTEDKYAEGGHGFSLNKEIMYSYDVCGGCESHAILYSYENNLVSDIRKGLLLDQLDDKYKINNVHFLNCPI